MSGFHSFIGIDLWDVDVDVQVIVPIYTLPCAGKCICLGDGHCW